MQNYLNKPQLPSFGKVMEGYRIRNRFINTAIRHRNSRR